MSTVLTTPDTHPGTYIALKRAILGTAAFLTALNAVFMIADPANWYATIEGVANTGPFNGHFVRDIGLAFLTQAIALGVAAIWLWMAFPLMITVTSFLCLHALLHVWEVTTGGLPLDHIVMDAPGVFLPSVLSIALTYWLRPTPSAAQERNPL